MSGSGDKKKNNGKKSDPPIEKERKEMLREDARRMEQYPTFSELQNQWAYEQERASWPEKKKKDKQKGESSKSKK